MTPEEFLEYMKQDAFHEGCDVESSHEYADIVITDVLDELGYGEGVLVFLEADKSYYADGVGWPHVPQV